MDEIGREYVVLGLAVGELEEGVVDSYFGPQELRAEAVARQATPQQLVGDLAALRDRVNAAEIDAQRARWFDRQLVGLETIARKLGGEEIDYVTEVELCFDAPPTATPPEAYAEVRRRLDALLPPGASLHERLEARDNRMTIEPDRVLGLLEWVVGELRAQCAPVFSIPAGDSLELSVVTNEPWSAYNWYEGRKRSRIEFNTDMPTRAHSLVGILGHEAFPGHHLEHASKEQRLVNEQGRVEASIQLINTPEAYISEGLAEVGPKLLVDKDRWVELLLAICERAGIDITAEYAAREWEVGQAIRLLRGSGGDAALMLHAEGRSRDDVKEFLIDDALRTPEQAEKSFEFMTHPLWRTYTFCYAGGERLLTRWIEAADGITAQRQRFTRLLTEQLTPSGIAEELPQA
jgi:hypothetical protein